MYPRKRNVRDDYRVQRAWCGLWRLPVIRLRVVFVSGIAPSKSPPFEFLPRFGEASKGRGGEGGVDTCSYSGPNSPDYRLSKGQNPGRR